MGAGTGLSCPRVVLDTNTVVSALLFDKGRLVWIRQAWQSSTFVPLVDHDTASELVRVLGYPKLKLTRSDQEALLGDFLPYAETVSSCDWPTELPAIRDPKDVMFLALAKHAGADALVSGDGDILALRGQLGSVAILPATAFSEWLSQRPNAGLSKDSGHRWSGTGSSNRPDMLPFA